jgi:hypothetical protein
MIHEDKEYMEKLADVEEIDCVTMDGDDVHHTVEYEDEVETHKARRVVTFRKDDDVTKEFKNVDRDSEDVMVKKYKETADINILNDLYLLREPTLRVWARRYHYLGDSEEDVFADLRTVWMKCVSKYKYEASIRKVRTKDGGIVKDSDGNVMTVFKRTPFNTFLYTSLRNYISNIIKKKYSKKRLDDKGIPLETTMMSLDFDYGSDDGDGETMHGLIPDTKVQPVNTDAQDIIEEIAKGDREIKKALEDFVSDVHLKRLSTACRLCRGVLPLSKRSKSVLVRGGDAGHKLLREMIEFTGRFGDDFSITSYSVMSDRVSYEVYGHDAKLFRKVMKAVEAYKARSGKDFA